MAHFFEMVNDCARGFLDQHWVAFLKHSLDNPAAILIQAKRNNVFFDLVDEFNEWVWLDLMTHLLDYLLDHMVSIKVERAILDFSLVE